MESAPTVNGGRATNPRWPQPPGRPQSCVTRNPCRGRFHIGPVCGGAGARGRDKSRPYESILCFGPSGAAATARATVGRDAPSRRTLPIGPLVKGGESGDRGIAPPQNAARKKRQPAVKQSLRHGLRPCHLPLTREAKPPQTLRPTATPVGDDARIVPETPRRRKRPILKSPRCGGRNRPPYGTGKTGRLTGKPHPPRNPHPL